MRETFGVPDVSCAHCVSAIEGALRPLDGVTEARVDLEAKAVTVAWNDESVDRESIVGAIEDSGYPVGGLLSNPTFGQPI